EHENALAERIEALERTAEEQSRIAAEREAALGALEERLRVQAERVEREREGTGQASQDAFALLAELDAREQGLARRETELLEAQARLQVDGAGADAVAAKLRELEERESALAMRETSADANSSIEELREELQRREHEIESH